MRRANRRRTRGDSPGKAMAESAKRRRRRRKRARVQDRTRIERITSTYGHGMYHTCTSKRYYPTRDRVIEAMVRVEAVFGDKCYGYHCPYCGGWHLSTHDCGGMNDGFSIEEIRLGAPIETV